MKESLYNLITTWNQSLAIRPLDIQFWCREAMFAALEVAEIHEALEQSRAANGEVTAEVRSGSQFAKGKSQAKAEAKEFKGYAKKKKSTPSYPSSKSDWWGRSDWNSSWWESGKSTRWQKRQDSEAAQREAWVFNVWTGSWLRIFLRALKECFANWLRLMLILTFMSYRL